jgi:dTDP-4-amino-4,6-dideoxygalactose transaminase
LTLYPLLRLASLFSRDPLHDAFQERISVKEPGLPLRRPSPVRAKLGLRQLAAIEENNLRRREVGAALFDLLKDLPREILPDPPPDGEPIFMSFVLKVRDRKRVARDLLAKGVDTSPGYLRPCYNLDPFTQFAAQCPVAEEMAEKQLHLPIYPGLSKKRIDHIAGCVRRALTRN